MPPKHKSGVKTWKKKKEEFKLSAELPKISKCFQCVDISDCDCNRKSNNCELTGVQNNNISHTSS